MKNIIGSLMIACSMYSRIPVPQVEWTKERMRGVLCFFPLIGVVIGAAELLLFQFCSRYGTGDLFPVFLGTALPLVLTGGIHMDGFLDVTDARSSYGSREKKLEILKDPHIGAFAVIGLSGYLLVYAAALSVCTAREWRILAAVFVLERALSGLSLVCFPMAKKEGLAAHFSQTAGKRPVRLALLLWALCSGGWILGQGGGCGLFCLAAAGLTFWHYYRMSLREFGGISGDLAGFFLQCCERNVLLVLALCRLLGI